jgi:hypothetical protein
MRTRSIRQRFAGGVTALIVLSLLAIPATATHAWGNYHWARTSNPFPLQVGNNLTTAEWNTALTGAINDWNQSTVLHLNSAAGGTKAKPCKATLGRIEVCNATYGNSGWLGLATIYVSGDHITRATTKVNDTYFKSGTYNTQAWRNLVMCQEIAHDFGLDHQDEDFDNTNLGSCMDYTDDPSSNQHPNQDDYDQLLAIYDPDFTGTDHTGTDDSDLDGHLDDTTTVGGSNTNTAAAEEPNPDDPSTWGEVIRRDGKGRPSLYRKDFGNAEKVFTFVISADEAQGPTVGDGTGDGGQNDGGRNDGGRNDGGKRDGGKRDGGKKADSKHDGGKKDGGKQRQGHHDRHRHR